MKIYIKYIIFLFFPSIGCNTVFKYSLNNSKQDSIFAYKSMYYEENCCKFININNEFKIKIIGYSIGCNCGVVACASNCIGLSNEDTFRVLSLCNTDTSFHIGEIVRIIPDSFQPNISGIHIARQYSFVGSVEQQSLYNIKLKSLWGVLRHGE